MSVVTTHRTWRQEQRDDREQRQRERDAYWKTQMPSLLMLERNGFQIPDKLTGISLIDAVMNEGPDLEAYRKELRGFMSEVRIECDADDLDMTTPDWGDIL